MGDTLARVRSAALASLRPPLRLPLCDWIERNVFLPEGVSALPGAVRLWPFQREIANALGDPEIERVTLVKPVRVGFTTLLTGALASFVANDPAPILALLPTETIMQRSAATRPSTWNAEARTVEAVIASPAPVRRLDDRGEYLEILDANGLDLASAEGLAVIDSHRTDSGRDVLGRVERAWIEGGAVIALLRITGAQDAKWAVERISDGSLSGVSIGYTVAAWRAATAPGGRTKTAAEWSLSEVTLTSTPADPSARLRNTKGKTIPEAIETDAGQNRQTTPNVGQTRQDAERAHRAEFRTLVRAFGLDAETADDLIDDGATLVEAKAAILDATQEAAARPRVSGFMAAAVTIRPPTGNA